MFFIVIVGLYKFSMAIFVRWRKQLHSMCAR